MDKLDQLFIRACKSSDPTKRLLSVHRRFYGVYNETEQSRKIILSGILAGLIDKYCPMTTYELMTALHHSYYTPLGEYSVPEKCFETLVYRIRHAKKNTFTGCSSPLKYKEVSMILSNKDGVEFNVELVLKHGSKEDISEVGFLLLDKLEEKQRELDKSEIILGVKVATIPKDFYKQYVNLLIQYEDISDEEDMLSYYPDLPDFCEKYAGKTVRVFKDHDDWFILEDNNWCVPEGLLEFK